MGKNNSKKKRNKKYNPANHKIITRQPQINVPVQSYVNNDINISSGSIPKVSFSTIPPTTPPPEIIEDPIYLWWEERNIKIFQLSKYKKIESKKLLFQVVAGETVTLHGADGMNYVYNVYANDFSFNQQFTGNTFRIICSLPCIVTIKNNENIVKLVIDTDKDKNHVLESNGFFGKDGELDINSNENTVQTTMQYIIDEFMSQYDDSDPIEVTITTGEEQINSDNF